MELWTHYNLGENSRSFISQQTSGNPVDEGGFQYAPEDPLWHAHAQWARASGVILSEQYSHIWQDSREWHLMLAQTMSHCDLVWRLQLLRHNLSHHNGADIFVTWSALGGNLWNADFNSTHKVLLAHRMGRVSNVRRRRSNAYSPRNVLRQWYGAVSLASVRFGLGESLQDLWIRQQDKIFNK